MDASLVVPPFLDRRANDNTNAVALYLLPLMPFGYQDMTVPEAASVHVASGLWQFRAADDIARSVAQELDAARVFKESFNDARASQGDYVLTGEVLSTHYDAKMFSYGLSLYGPLLWFIGFPSSHTANTLELRLTLRAQNDDRAIWTHTISEDAAETGWIYALGEDFKYPDLLKRAMPAAIASLEDALRRESDKP